MKHFIWILTIHSNPLGFHLSISSILFQIIATVFTTFSSSFLWFYRSAICIYWSKVFLAGVLSALRGTPASCGWKWVLKTAFCYCFFCCICCFLFVCLFAGFFTLLSTALSYTNLKISPSILVLIALLYRLSPSFPIWWFLCSWPCFFGLQFQFSWDN